MAPEILYAVGAALLLAALIYGALQYSRRNRANEPITDKATKELYEHPDRYESKTHDELERKTRP